LPRYSDPVVCVYDLNKTSTEVAFDALRTHPMNAIGGEQRTRQELGKLTTKRSTPPHPASP
jgi:hypothetical protein